MTWTRLDDTWTDSSQLADLDLASRWHYLCMIQFCSRTKRYDGVLKVADARRCSDVEDPSGAMATLSGAGLLTTPQTGAVKVAHIDEHIPPPSVRNASDGAKVRKQRERAHKNGDHSTCLPDHCKHVHVDEQTGVVTGDVTTNVTRDTRTGQDGTGQLSGQEVSSLTSDEQAAEDAWFNPAPVLAASPAPTAPDTCSTCHLPMKAFEPGQTTHPGCDSAMDIGRKAS